MSFLEILLVFHKTDLFGVYGGSEEEVMQADHSLISEFLHYPIILPVVISLHFIASVAPGNH